MRLLFFDALCNASFRETRRDAQLVNAISLPIFKVEQGSIQLLQRSDCAAKILKLPEVPLSLIVAPNACPPSETAAQDRHRGHV